jgi:hypothetical protein
MAQPLRIARPLLRETPRRLAWLAARLRTGNGDEDALSALARLGGARGQDRKSTILLTHFTTIYDSEEIGG